MEVYDRVSLASKRAREMHHKTGLAYHVVSLGDGEGWCIVMHPTVDMVVWRSFINRSKKK